MKKLPRRNFAVRCVRYILQKSSECKRKTDYERNNTYNNNNDKNNSNNKTLKFLWNLINNNTSDANSFNGIVANFEKSKSRESLGVTLHVSFFNLALAGGQSLALIQSQQIQRRGRAPIFIKCQLPGFPGGCRSSDRRQYPGSLSRMSVPSIIFIGWHRIAYLGHCGKRS